MKKAVKFLTDATRTADTKSSKKRHFMYVNVGDGIVTLCPDSKFYK